MTDSFFLCFGMTGVPMLDRWDADADSDTGLQRYSPTASSSSSYAPDGESFACK